MENNYIKFCRCLNRNPLRWAITGLKIDWFRIKKSMKNLFVAIIYTLEKWFSEKVLHRCHKCKQKFVYRMLGYGYYRSCKCGDFGISEKEYSKRR